MIMKSEQDVAQRRGKTAQERGLMIRSMNNFDAVNRKSGAAAFTFNGLSAM